MGRLLKNKQNVDNTDANYPNGRIKDDDGSSNGTPVDEQVYGDLHQTEERGIEEVRRFEGDSNVDKLPDSNLNDYQFHHARRKNQPYAELYKNGLFRDVLTNLGVVDFVADCAVWTGELYVCDQGSNDVEVFRLDGSATRTIANGVVAAAIAIQVVYTGADQEPLIYIVDNVNNNVKVFGAYTGAPNGSFDITTVISAPVSVHVDWVNQRVYVLDGGSRVEVFNQTTAAHIPGESFSVGAGALDLFVDRTRNRIYTLTPTKIFAYTVNGTAQVSEDITGLTAAKKFHIVGEKMYIVANAPTDVIVHDLRKVSPLSQEDVPNGLLGNSSNIFIRHGILYSCDASNNNVKPIRALNVQEIQ